MRRTLRTGLALGSLALFLGLGACNKGSRVTMADLEAENQELRERNAQVERALNDCEDARAQMESERDQLIAENARLRDDVSQRPTSAFDGIAGTTVSGRAGELAVSVAGDVLFASGSADLKSSAKSTLDQIAGVLRSEYGGYKIRIAGHTDSDPIRKSKWKTNERLSAERALAVEEYLESKGISGDQMYIAGYGSAVPRGAKKDSRRVEIVIIAQGT